jgi:hypothetical protein
MIRLLLVAVAVPALSFAETEQPVAASAASPAASEAAPSDAPPPASVASEPTRPVLAPAVSSEPATAEPGKKARAAVTASWGELSVGLLLQGWFSASSNTRFNAGSTTAKFTPSGDPARGTSTFRVRRAETTLEGKLAGGVGVFRLMFDPANVQNGPISFAGTNDPTTNSVRGSATVKDVLQDLYVGARVPWHEVQFGQFKVPMTMEGFGSSSKLDFAERAIVTRTFGDQRDLGLMLLSKNVPFVEYEVAVVNGTGKNVVSNSPRKGGMARLVFEPLEGVSFGGSGQVVSVYDASSNGYLKSNRAGAELAVELFGATVKAEYLGGASGAYDSGSDTSYVLSPVGWYGTLGYRFGQTLLAARYERWESDKDTAVAQCQPGGTYAGTANARCVKNDVLAVGVSHDLTPKTPYGIRLQLTYYNDLDRVQKVRAHEAFVTAQMKL